MDLKVSNMNSLKNIYFELIIAVHCRRTLVVIVLYKINALDRVETSPSSDKIIPFIIVPPVFLNSFTIFTSFTSSELNCARLKLTVPFCFQTNNFFLILFYFIFFYTFFFIYIVFLGLAGPHTRRS